MKNTQTSLTKTEPQKPLVKIRHLDNYAGLRANLIAISYLLGVKEAPDEKIINRMIGVIKDEYGYFTIQDITDAVKKGLAGKLTINGKVLDLETYNNFSIPYVCKFLAAYREYMSNNGTLLPKPQESPEMSKEEVIRLRNKWLNNIIYPLLEKYFKTGEYNIPDYGSSLYNYLKGKFIDFSEQRKKVIQREARKQLLMELNVKLNKSGLEKIKDEMVAIILQKQTMRATIITQAKKVGLKIFLIECKEMNRDLITEIKQYESMS